MAHAGNADYNNRVRKNDEDEGKTSLSKEEKEKMLDLKVKEMQKKNEERLRRYEEVQADKRNAGLLSKMADMNVKEKDTEDERHVQNVSKGRGRIINNTVSPQKRGDEAVEDVGNAHRGRGTSAGRGVRGGNSGASTLGSPPPDPKYKFLSDRTREGPLPGSPEKNKQAKYQRNPEPSGVLLLDHEPSKREMEVIMTGRERLDYVQWKEERAEIDRERMARTKTTSGEWRREWDEEKQSRMDDNKRRSKFPVESLHGGDQSRHYDARAHPHDGTNTHVRPGGRSMLDSNPVSGAKQGDNRIDRRERADDGRFATGKYNHVQARPNVMALRSGQESVRQGTQHREAQPAAVRIGENKLHDRSSEEKPQRERLKLKSRSRRPIDKSLDGDRMELHHEGSSQGAIHRGADNKNAEDASTAALRLVSAHDDGALKICIGRGDVRSVASVDQGKAAGLHAQLDESPVDFQISKKQTLENRMAFKHEAVRADCAQTAPVDRECTPSARTDSRAWPEDDDGQWEDVDEMTDDNELEEDQGSELNDSDAALRSGRNESMDAIERDMIAQLDENIQAVEETLDSKSDEELELIYGVRMVDGTDDDVKQCVNRLVDSAAAQSSN